MYISESLCNPQVCKYECQDACTRIHGDDSPLGFGKESLYPIIDEETCTECLACVHACPLNALSLNESQEAIPEPIPPPNPYPSNQSHGRRHRTVVRFIQHLPWLGRFIVKSDKMSERGKENNK